MRIPEEISERFYIGERTDEVRFVVGDSARVNGGPHVGRTVAIISLLVLHPEVVFLVEPGEPPYGDLEVAQVHLGLLS